MVDLGTLGGLYSEAMSVSGDGNVVVGGSSTTGGAAWRAFRWTQATGMQSVEDWLRGAGVSVPTDITYQAFGTNSDGSVVVGVLENNHAFLARVASTGGGLITLDDVAKSLTGTAQGANTALSTGNLIWNGAHSRPLSRRVGEGQSTFWLTGDWGRDDHGSRDGDVGLAELGFGINFGAAQLNLAVGDTWADQDQVLNGRTEADGTYFLAQALLPLQGKLWAVLGGYVHRGEADIRRGYLNAGLPDASTGSPDLDTWSVRARLEWDKAVQLGHAHLSPYADLTYTEAELDGYTETGGGFPARFNSREDEATELRLGVNAQRPVSNDAALFGILEAVHRFEKDGARTSGEIIGLFPFALDGRDNQRDWARLGAGVEGKLAAGRAALSVNVTTQGEAPNAWVSATWQKAF